MSILTNRKIARVFLKTQPKQVLPTTNQLGKDANKSKKIQTDTSH